MKPRRLPRIQEEDHNPEEEFLTKGPYFGRRGTPIEWAEFLKNPRGASRSI